jgi:ABC-type lipoprotein export system ATPase subunit
MMAGCSMSELGALGSPYSGPATGGKPLLQALALRRVFRQGGLDIVAVSNASCTILPGDRIAIAGPSGSGKSTLLHLFAGLDQPTSGTLCWPALGPRPGLRPTQIGVALQLPGLLPSLTVAENVALPLLLSQVAPEDARAAAQRILEEQDLDTLAAKLPEELSGGQAQRVSLARALVTRPCLILADEPTGQLDHPTAQHMLDLLFSTLDGNGAALIVTTHDPSIAERLDRVWKMQQGFLTGKTNS